MSRPSSAVLALAALCALACDDGGTVPDCEFRSIAVDARNVIGELRLADDARAWTVQRAAMQAQCGGQVDAELHVVTIDDSLDLAELDRVVCHELGHVLGLGHVPESDAVMFREATRVRPAIESASVTRQVATWNVWTRPSKRLVFAPAVEPFALDPADIRECVRAGACEAP